MSSHRSADGLSGILVPLLGLIVGGVALGGLGALVLAPQPSLVPGIGAAFLALLLSSLVGVLVLGTERVDEWAPRPAPREDVPGRTPDATVATHDEFGPGSRQTTGGLRSIQNPARDTAVVDAPARTGAVPPPTSRPVTEVAPTSPLPVRAPSTAVARPTHAVLPDWWTRPARDAPTGAPAPGPELDLEDLDRPVQIAACPACNDFGLDVVGRGDEYEFSCRQCGHRWSWRAGQTWPPPRTNPSARTPS